MARDIFTSNGSTPWFIIHDNLGVSIAAKGTWGSGTVTVEHYLFGAEDLLDSDDVVVSKTADFNAEVSLKKGEAIRMTLSGAASPSLKWSINGNVSVFNP